MLQLSHSLWHCAQIHLYTQATTFHKDICHFFLFILPGRFDWLLEERIRLTPLDLQQSKWKETLTEYKICKHT